MYSYVIFFFNVNYDANEKLNHLIGGGLCRPLTSATLDEPPMSWLMKYLFTRFLKNPKS